MVVKFSGIQLNREEWKSPHFFSGNIATTVIHLIMDEHSPYGFGDVRLTQPFRLATNQRKSIRCAIN